MKKWLKTIVLSILVLAVSFFITKYIKNGNSKLEAVSVSSLLTDTADIAELSTAEFKYRGIADIYKDEAKKKLLCRVCYDAIVKAEIDLNKIESYKDDDNKTYIITLPDINLKVTLADEKSMSLLPSDSKVELVDMINASLEDAENEANNNKDLMKVARENLEDTVEGIIYPLIESEGYSITWK